MTSLALFLQQCLTEEKYGSTFVSEIDQRLETLNYIQLVKMHEVVMSASKAAKMKTWQEGNDEVLKHVEKWLALRKKEHEIKAAREEEVLRRIKHKEKMKRLNEREKERVIQQLQEKARIAAEEEVKHLEVQRKASYKEQLYQVVEIAEKKRNYHLIGGVFFCLIGCIISGLLIKSTFMLMGTIGGIILITLFIFYRAYRVSQVAPFDDHPDLIKKQIQTREEELFQASMEIIYKNERDYEAKMNLDKSERKKRKQERRHREEVLKYLENHPEIPINPEEGDVDLQLQEYLKRNDPNRRGLVLEEKDGDDDNDNDEDDDENNSADEKKNREKKGDKDKDKEKKRIEIIHERSHEEDDEDENEDESKGDGDDDKKERRRSGSDNFPVDIAPGKQSSRDIPETNPLSSHLLKSTSSKYLLDDSRQENSAVIVATPAPSQLKSIQIKLLKLSEFLQSFHETAPSEVFLLIRLGQNPEPGQGQGQGHLTDLFKTDSQKCVGDVLLWRYENIILPLTNNYEEGYLQIELHSNRPLLDPSSSSSTTSPSVTPLAAGTLLISDLLHHPEETIIKTENMKKTKKRNNKIVLKKIPMIRNDVVRVCELTMEYQPSALMNTDEK